MSKLIRAVDAAQAVSEQFGISLADLVDVFAEIPSQETEPVKETIGSHDPKMTESEIMKALECCVHITEECDNCPYFENTEHIICTDSLIEDALDLINRKNAKIETARAEAIKEFARMVKKEFGDGNSWLEIQQKGFRLRVDQIAKEMGVEL